MPCGRVVTLVGSLMTADSLNKWMWWSEMATMDSRRMNSAWRGDTEGGSGNARVSRKNGMTEKNRSKELAWREHSRVQIIFISLFEM